VPEIATITGHSLKDIQAIVDAQYFGWTHKARGARRSPSWAPPARRREPMANKNWKTIKPFQIPPGISG